jgi:hypothetical protein
MTDTQIRLVLDHFDSFFPNVGIVLAAKHPDRRVRFEYMEAEYTEMLGFALDRAGLARWRQASAGRDRSRPGYARS